MPTFKSETSSNTEDKIKHEKAENSQVDGVTLDKSVSAGRKNK